MPRVTLPGELPGRSKTTARRRGCPVTVFEFDARERHHYALREAVSCLDIDRRLRDVHHLNLQFVRGAAIVTVEHAHAVGNHKALLERRTAPGEDAEKMTGRHF